jgi:hypothetical protein
MSEVKGSHDKTLLSQSPFPEVRFAALAHYRLFVPRIPYRQ